MKTQLHYYLVLLCTLACYVTGYSQINYSQNFNVDEGGWDDTFFWASTTQTCGGMSLRGEFYYIDYGDGDIYTETVETVSPSLGTSNGLPVTLSYNYKLFDYWIYEPLGNYDWGNVTVSYGTSPSGPWTTLHTITPTTHVSSGDCAVKTATFTPTLGAQIYLRVVGTPTQTDPNDVLLVLDEITAVQQLPACTGVPAASAAVVLNGPVCAQQNASVGLTPAYTASGMTYQWQGSPNGTTFTNIAGATGTTLSATQAQGPWYRAVVTCTGSGSSTTSAAIQATFSTANCVGCAIDYVNSVEPITSVTFSNLTNTSDALVNGTPDVENFTALAPANVTTGQAYTFSAQGNTDGNFMTYVKVYIDFNKNGNLNDPGESFQIGVIENSNGSDGITATAPIFIPTNASAGITSMRVFKLYNAYSSDPCGTGYGYGQVEDYLVNITQCTTVAPTATATQTFCANATVANLAVTGTGVKWYAAASGGAALPTTQALVNGTVYYASQTNVCEGSARAAVTANITVVPIDDPADVTNCGPYILPALTNGVYRTAIGGGGTVVAAGTSISATTTLYVHATLGACSVDNSVLITISNPVADDPADVIACGTYILPALTNGTYRTATAGGGTVVTAGTAITESTTLYVYAGTPTCNAENSFTLTINNAEADDPADVVTCSGYTLPALTNGAYYTEAGGLGDMIAAGTVVSGNTTLYVYNMVGTCSAENSFTITIDNFEVDQLEDVTVCSEYVLPELTNGTYYTGGSGLGDMLEPGDVIDQTITLHIYGVSQDNPACTADTSFTVTVINVEADELEDVSVCSGYVLPELSVGNNYYTGSGMVGTMLSAGDIITSDMIIYIYTEVGDATTCSDETSFTVTIEEVFAPTGNDSFEFVIDDLTDYYFLYQAEIEAQGVITWYETEEDALNGENALPEDFILPIGTNTYYVTQTMGECESEPFEVTITVTTLAGAGNFDMAAFSYYPNPVTDVLNLSYSENITGIQVVNLLGQQIMSGTFNQDKVQLNLSQLASGTYLVKVQTENASKIIKVVKNK